MKRRVVSATITLLLRRRASLYIEFVFKECNRIVMNIYNRTQVIPFKSLVTKSGYYTLKVSQVARDYILAPNMGRQIVPLSS